MAPAVRKFRYDHLPGTYNDSNHHDLAPFSVDADGTLAVEAGAYDGWAATDALSLVAALFPAVRRADGPVTRIDRDAAAPKWFYAVYTALLSRANAARWWGELVHAGGVVAVPPERNAGIATADVANADKKWLAGAVQHAMDTSVGSPPERGWFVKCGTCSTKHQYPVAPMFSGVEAVEHLLGAEHVRAAFATGAARCVAIRPWDPEIASHNELRAFATAGVVTGVSQQSCHAPQPVLHLLDGAELIAAVQRCYDAAMAALPPGRRFPHECTFDAYISTTTEGEIEARLIEINSGMFGWGPSGSALFHWRDDPPPKPDEPPVVYLRTSAGVG
jgi:hypothetical protein